MSRLDLARMRNDDGVNVRPGTDVACAHLFYCGRHLGMKSIPGSNGQCGPGNGPQCPACCNFQYRYSLKASSGAAGGGGHDSGSRHGIVRKASLDFQQTIAPTQGPTILRRGVKERKVANATHLCDRYTVSSISNLCRLLFLGFWFQSRTLSCTDPLGSYC